MRTVRPVELKESSGFHQIVYSTLKPFGDISVYIEQVGINTAVILSAIPAALFVAIFFYLAFKFKSKLVGYQSFRFLLQYIGMISLWTSFVQIEYSTEICIEAIGYRSSYLGFLGFLSIMTLALQFFIILFFSRDLHYVKTNRF